MPTSIVRVGTASIKTTVTEKEGDINRLVKAFLSNKNNMKKIIGLDTERVQKGRRQNKTALLQLCDGGNCLIVQLPDDDEGGSLPQSLFNFLNLPDFTFVGIGIDKTMMKLESEFGLTCKNVVEIGPATWSLNNKLLDVKFIISTIVSTENPTNAVFDDWEKCVLNKNQIKLAASNAYLAFGLGNYVLDGIGF